MNHLKIWSNALHELHFSFINNGYGKRKQRVKKTITKISYLLLKFNESSQYLIKCMLFMKCISHSTITVMESSILWKHTIMPLCRSKKAKKRGTSLLDVPLAVHFWRIHSCTFFGPIYSFLLMSNKNLRFLLSNIT